MMLDEKFDLNQISSNIVQHCEQTIPTCWIELNCAAVLLILLRMFLNILAWRQY